MNQSEVDKQREEALNALGADTANLELLSSELAGRLARQEDANGKVDTKVAFLLGLIATATQFLASRHPQPVLGALAFAGYALAFGLGVPALVIRPFRELEPRALYDSYGLKSKPETLLMLCAVRVNNYEKNNATHEAKSKWWWRSFIVTIVALVVSVGAIVDAGSHGDSTGQQLPVSTASSTAPSAPHSTVTPAPAGTAKARSH